MTANEQKDFASRPVGIIGMGYVGLPLALCFVERGSAALGFDIDPNKPEALAKGESYLKHIPSDRIASANATGLFSATTDFSRVSECRAVVLCVPTPLTESREPDLTYIEESGKAIAPHLVKGQLISLESTTFPGTTRDVLLPILEQGSGLKAGTDFHLVFSPEREDPGNPKFSTGNIPKVLGGLTPACNEQGVALYGQAVNEVVPVTSMEAAELTKLLENIFRSVNIALVNELKVLCHRLTDAGTPIDVHEVIRAASTKPFGFMPFYPGPGLGGHCIPIDPFYLTWKARQVDQSTRFIELAGEINTAMPYYVVDRLMRALSDQGKGLRGAKVLVLGVAYKSDVDDTRESPTFKVMELLEKRGVELSYHDPHVPEVKPTRHYDFNMSSVELSPEVLKGYDAAVIVTAHKAVDYDMLAKHAPLIVDTRDAMREFEVDEARLVNA